MVKHTKLAVLAFALASLPLVGCFDDDNNDQTAAQNSPIEETPGNSTVRNTDVWETSRYVKNYQCTREIAEQVFQYSNQIRADFFPSVDLDALYAQGLNNNQIAAAVALDKLLNELQVFLEDAEEMIVAANEELSIDGRLLITRGLAQYAEEAITLTNEAGIAFEFDLGEGPHLEAIARLRSLEYPVKIVKSLSDGGRVMSRCPTPD